MNHSFCKGPGSLCNQICRIIYFNYFVEKFNLYTKYEDTVGILGIRSLGITLYNGTKTYNNTKILMIKKGSGEPYIKDHPEKNVYEIKDVHYNLHTAENFYGHCTYQMCNIIYDYFNRKNIRDNIIKSNPFQSRYDNNNDIFIHVRLGDVEHLFPGLDHIYSCINRINNYNNIYLATGHPCQSLTSRTFNHKYVKQIKEKYPNIIFVDKSPIETIQFGSTCKHIIISSGSFSFIISVIAFFSNIYSLQNASHKFTTDEREIPYLWRRF